MTKKEPVAREIATFIFKKADLDSDDESWHDLMYGDLVEKLERMLPDDDK